MKNSNGKEKNEKYREREKTEKKIETDSMKTRTGRRRECEKYKEREDES